MSAQDAAASLSDGNAPQRRSVVRVLESAQDAAASLSDGSAPQRRSVVRVLKRTVAVTQRVVVDPPHGTRRDCLDQAWTKFLLECGLIPIPIPNSVDAALTICEKVDGIVLTGGNDLTAYGGDAPDRDETENALLDLAERQDLPVLGVCRGMQVIQNRFGTRLEKVAGHVAPRQRILIDGRRVEVNSFHHFGATEVHPPLTSWAIADDGVIKAVRHQSRRIVGLMWHPERLEPFLGDDIALFSRFFEA